MLAFDARNVTVERVTQAHGLDLDTLYMQNVDLMRRSVEALYAAKEQSGQWCAWLNLGEQTRLADELTAYAKAQAGRFDDMVVLGIGGSSLGGYALLNALCHPQWNLLSTEQREGRPRYHFVDNVDSDAISGLSDILNPDRTLLIVISKSGTTAEPMSAFMFFQEWLAQTRSTEQIAQQVVAITDPKAGILRPLAEASGYTTFEVPDDVGGRFSIFSAVGLLPAAMCGIDLTEIQRGIRDIDTLLRNPDIHQNPAAQNALIQVRLYQQGKAISVFMPYASALASVSDWYVQLWAESLGKREDLDGQQVFIGPTPVRAVGVTDQHSQVQLFNHGPHDKVITFVRVAEPHQQVTIPDAFPAYQRELGYLATQTFSCLMEAEFEGTRLSLTQSQRPNVTFTLPRVDAYHVAQLFYTLQVQTALAGHLFNVDPFDQPGVEDGKKIARALLGDPALKDLAQTVQQALGNSSPPKTLNAV